MKATRRLGVIGFGSMGRKHARNGLELGLSVGVYDPVSGVTDPQISGFESVEALLAWCDAVVIASPSDRHGEHLIAAVDAGRPSLVEKPFADRLEGMSQCLDLADAHGVVVAVAQNLRHHPAVERARDLMAGGALGAMRSAVSIGASYLPDWRPGTEIRANYAASPEHGGVIFDWVHEIDLLAHLMGPFQAAGAVAETNGVLALESDEQAGLLLRHRTGAISTIFLSYAVRPALRRTTLMGEGGVLEIDIPARRLAMRSADGRLNEVLDFGGEHADDYRTELAAFLDAAASGTAPRCPGREALDILTGVIALRRQAGLPCAGDR